MIILDNVIEYITNRVLDSMDARQRRRYEAQCEAAEIHGFVASGLADEPYKFYCRHYVDDGCEEVKDEVEL